MDIINMVCLITGSSRGLGKELALYFGRKGHRIAVHCKESMTEAENVASQVGEYIVLQADVRIYKDIKAAVDKVIERWGRIDVLVNNAGVTKESLLIKTSEQDFDDVINTNLKGPFNLIRAVGRHMMKQRSGHIINISSYAGVKGKEGLTAYSTSKAGLIGLTKTAARELSRYNIMVNAVLPGFMLTDMGADSRGKAKEKVLKESLVKDYSHPVKIAEFIGNFSEASGITGQVFNLDSRVI